MTYDDFMKILDDTQSIIISKDLFKTLLDSQIPDRISEDEKKRIYDEGQYAALGMIKAEIYEEFMMINGRVQDKSAEKCMQIIDKYRGLINRYREGWV